MSSRPWMGAAIAVAFGCGGASPDGTTTPEDGPTPWAQMSHEQKRDHMAEVVLPRMAPLFEEHDAERFAGFSCDGCHGEDMRARQFSMPNPGIMALSPTGTEAQAQMVREHPEMVRFMFNRVLPTMRDLLGAAEFDEETGEGFTCFACHTRAGSIE